MTDRGIVRIAFELSALLSETGAASDDIKRTRIYLAPKVYDRLETVAAELAVVQLPGPRRMQRKFVVNGMTFVRRSESR